MVDMMVQKTQDCNMLVADTCKITKEYLIDFEKEIEIEWVSGHIRAPVHFSGSKDGLYEEWLIRIFSENNIGDNNIWLFSNHRSHFHALLKGVPPELVKSEILAGRSMQLNFKDYKFFTSSIVGGNLPIAIGVALGIKRSGGSEKVWCFTGDMASTTGIFYESHKYSVCNDLPITFVIEDNGLSVNTPTQDSWGKKFLWTDNLYGKVKVIRYERAWPHAGCGQFVNFV